MKTICLIGGGRWARVLMSVLVKTLPADAKIVWVTRFGDTAARAWCEQRGEQRIEFVPKLTPGTLGRLDAAIVATAPHQHYAIVKRLLSAHVPTLCEKPLVLYEGHCSDLERLSLKNNCPLGIDLELTYASYLEEFSARIRSLKLRRLDLLWMDPWSEERYGETKYSDVYTNVIDDMFPHCWTQLAALAGQPDWQVQDVRYCDNHDVLVQLFAGDLQASIRFSRRAERRIRVVDVNEGQAKLDFSTEPGFIDMDGQRDELQWRTERPLTRSIQSFLAVVADRQRWPEWPLSITNCRQSVKLSTKLAEQLQQRQLDLLDTTERCDEEYLDSFRNRLLLDVFIPLAAQQDTRIDFTNEQVIKEFYRLIEDFLATDHSGKSPKF